jgi:hypothetical protein
MTMNTRPCSGFILPLTLWIVAIMGLIVASVNTWVQTAVANAHSLRDKTDDQLATADIRNELLYALATRPKSARGLEVGVGLPVVKNQDFMEALSTSYTSSRAIAFDNRAYTVEDHPDYVIKIQDGRGLFQLNYATPAPLRRFLGVMNIPDTERNRLADTLTDYVDEDDYTRMAGAEAPEYARLGLPPPANEPLLTPYEAKLALGWSDAKDLWEADMRAPLLTTCQVAGFNPNTAPIPVLTTQLPHLSPDAIQRLSETRTVKAIANQTELSQAAGELIYDEAFFFSFMPGQCSIIEVFKKASQEHVRFSLTLRPTNRAQPWRYDYELRIPAQYIDQTDQVAGTALFPTPESLSADAHADSTPDGVR